MIVKKPSLVLINGGHTLDSMNTSYSRYAALPADRDLERIAADLRALPTPCEASCPPRPSRFAWLRGRRLTHTGRVRPA